MLRRRTVLGIVRRCSAPCRGRPVAASLRDPYRLERQHVARENQDPGERQRTTGREPRRPENRAAASPLPQRSLQQTAEKAPVRLVKAAYWTDFRGPNRAGAYNETPINTDWPAAGLPRLWKQPIGGGYASFTVARAARTRSSSAAIKKRLRRTMSKRAASCGRSPIQRRSTRCSADLGRALPRSITTAWFTRSVPWATSTASWRRQVNQNGRKTSSPIMMRRISTGQWPARRCIVDDMVIVTPGGTGGKSIVAYNRLTGAPIWKSLNDRAAYTSPILATLSGKRQIVWISGERAVGLSVADGKLLWEYPWPAQMDMNCSQPVVIDDSDVLLSSAQGPGAALLKIANEGDGVHGAARLEK